MAIITALFAIVVLPFSLMIIVPELLEIIPVLFRFALIRLFSDDQPFTTSLKTCVSLTHAGKPSCVLTTN